MPSPIGSRQFRERIIGRTISGVIARPGREGEPPVVMMLRFDDGDVVEFVSPRSDRLLKDALDQSRSGLPDWREISGLEPGAQLSLEGMFSHAARAGAGAGPV